MFGLLGPLYVIGDDGSPIVIRQAMRRSLLVILLMHPNIPVTSLRLAKMLWGEDLPVKSSSALRTHVWGLRRALAPADRLRTTGHGYCLEVRPGELDVDSFSRALAQGLAMLRRGECHAAARVLGEALQLWREPPLAELPPTPVVKSAADRLLSQRQEAFDAYAETMLATGRHFEIIGDLRKRVAENPVGEHAWEQLMLALYRSGQRADALDAYAHVRMVLAEQHGIDPGPGLRRLQLQILRDDPALGWPRAGTSGS